MQGQYILPNNPPSLHLLLITNPISLLPPSNMFLLPLIILTPPQSSSLLNLQVQVQIPPSIMLSIAVLARCNDSFFYISSWHNTSPLPSHQTSCISCILKFTIRFVCFLENKTVVELYLKSIRNDYIVAGAMFCKFPTTLPNLRSQWETRRGELDTSTSSPDQRTWLPNVHSTSFLLSAANAWWLSRHPEL